MSAMRVKHCCCGCTLDIGARIIIWTDLIATVIVGLSVITHYRNDYVWALSALIIPVKFLILVGAVIGMNKKKASYVYLYVMYNVLAIFTMGVLIIVAITQFAYILDSDLMKYMMGSWEAVKTEYRRGHRWEQDHQQDDIYGQPTRDTGLLDSAQTEYRARFVFLFFAILGGIVNLFVWVYFNIVLYSYYKTLAEGGNFTNVDGVEYFAPTEQIGGKRVPQGGSPQYNVPPSHFAAAPYPVQPVIPYPQAPPTYEEAAYPNTYANPLPPTK